MSPVFTFDMSVVVAVIFARASEQNRVLTVEEIINEKAVDEFTPVIGVKTENGKRQRVFHIFDLPGDIAEALTVSGALFRPVSSNINGVGCIGEMTSERSAAMSDGVRFKEART